jgi:hypothetical protein
MARCAPRKTGKAAVEKMKYHATARRRKTAAPDRGKSARTPLLRASST